MGKLLILAVFGILAALVAERILRLRQTFNISREYEQLEPPNCRFIEGIETGAEDIDILPNGLAFMSSGLKYPGAPYFAPDEHGKMLLLDVNEEEPKPVVLGISSGFDIDSFNPHGISVYIDDKDDSVYVFVVNHPKVSTTVELFKFQEEEKSLLHLKTIEHELLQSVNDIAAVGPESFYATNDHYFLNSLGRVAELYLNLPLENVVYYSPTEVKEVATGFNFANGIIMSHDKKYVYVASLFDNSISVFEKHANWSLSQVKDLQIDKLVDNLCIDPTTGDVWMACHIDGWQLFNYNPKNPPGSEVLRLQNILSENPVLTQVYVNNGSKLQASSVACVHDGRLVVGSVFHKAIYCDLE
ncbi:serum paraoxonase/arylesterase 2-like isoform X1 [Pleurodeles waltl]|uniref:serum paraoxonase/arylesterase 2-like isoform X1 n=1 Tax=Pleurodeles waltl TaxID=8319 RepID=UPI0037098AFC